MLTFLYNPVISMLDLFGLMSQIAMLIFYHLEQHDRKYVLAFAGSCVWGAIYGFLQGAWPIGLAELVWGYVAVSKWKNLRV